MSKRPAEHSDSDRSTRNAGFDAESARIWSISGRNHLSHAESDFYRSVEPLAAPARGRAWAQRPKPRNFWRVFYRSAEENYPLATNTLISAKIAPAGNLKSSI